MSKLFIGAYWKSRRASVGSCADRLEKWLRTIDEIAGQTVLWRYAVRRKPRLEELICGPEREKCLRELLLLRRNRTDVGNRVIPSLGFSVSFLSGGDSHSTSELHIHCGAYSRYIGNCLTWDRPEEVIGAADVQPYLEVLTELAELWEPDWAGVMSREAMRTRDYDVKPFVDWMFYVCDDWWSQPPVVDPPAVVRRLSGGNLIVVQDAIPDPHDPKHLAQIQRVQQSINPALDR